MNKNIIKLYEYKCEFEILDSWIQWTALPRTGKVLVLFPLLVEILNIKCSDP